MTKHTIFNTKKTNIKNDTDIKSNEKMEATKRPDSNKRNPLMEFEMQYNYETSRQINRKDAQIGTTIETDNVNVSVQTRSVTDLTRASSTNDKPINSVQPIITADGKHVFLRATRSKAVNTIGISSMCFVDPCILLKCKVPGTGNKMNFAHDLCSIELLRNVVCDTGAREDSTLKFIVTESLHAPRETIANESGSDKVIEVKTAMQKCEQTCAFTVGDETPKIGTTKPRGTDNEEIVVSATAPIKSTEIEEENAEERKQLCTVNEAANEVNTSTQTHLTSIEEEENEESDASIEECFSTREIKEELHKCTETTMILNDVQTDAERDIEMMEEQEESVKHNKITCIVNDTHDVCVNSPDNRFIEEGNSLNTTNANLSEISSRDDKTAAELPRQTKVSKNSRRPSMYRLETETTITNRTFSWMDTPIKRSRRNFRDDYARTSESFCCASRESEGLSHCSRIASPSMTSHFVQCETFSGGVRSMTNQTICDESRENAEHWRTCDHCCSNWRACDVKSTRCNKFSEFSSKDRCTFEINPSYGSFQGPFMRHQSCGKNNSQGHSMAGEVLENCMQNRSNRNNAWNQYYLNVDKTANIGRKYCWCNNGYNLHNGNMFYCAGRNQMVCQTPAKYYYSFSAWY